MRLRVHLPTAIDAPADWDPEQRARVQRVVARAIERAARTIEARGVAVELVRPARPGSSRFSGRPPRPVGPARERIDPTRSDEAGYGIPSYDRGGAPVDVPLRPSGNPTANAPETAEDPELTIRFEAGQDRIVRRDFPRVTVLKGLGPTYSFASGNPYVVATNLWHARQWGNDLFGELGYAILLPDNAAFDGPFYVVGLDHPLRSADLHQIGADDQGNPGYAGYLIKPAHYSTVTVVTADKVPLFRFRQGQAGWTLDMFEKALARVPRGQRALDPTSVQSAISFILPAPSDQGPSDDRELDLLVNLNRTAFAAMPWETRVRYLLLLLDAWGDDRRRHAIVEIVEASTSGAELEAIFSLLRERGVYEKLFAKLDSEAFGLLEYLGEFRQEQSLDPRYLVNLAIELGLIPSVAPDDPLRELQRMVDGLLGWLSGMLGGFVDLFMNFDQFLDAIPHLGQFLWVLLKAENGDPEALAFVARMLRAGAARVLKAMRGLAYAEELGTPYGRRGGGAKIGGDVLGRLKWALVFEVLSWFIGIGEIKAAASSLELGEKIAIVARLLRSVRLLGRAAEVGEEAARLERVLQVLARMAEIAEDARVACAVELLPPEHVALVERLGQAAHLPEGATIDALRLALKGNHELLSGADRVADALAVAARLDLAAERAGVDVARLADGFRALLLHAGLDRAALVDVIEHIPAGRLEEYLHTLTFVRPQNLRAWGGPFLRELAGHPRALGFIREAGSDLVAPVTRRLGGWEEFDRFLEGLELQRQRLGDPAKYQQFLERLRGGDAAAFDDVARGLRAQRVAAAAQAGPARVAELGEAFLREGRRTNLIRELERVERIDRATARAELAAEIARLSENEVSGLEQIAAIEYQSVAETASRDWDWQDLLHLPDVAERTTLLTTLHEVGPVTSSGLEKAIGRVVADPQAGLGQLLAARALVRHYGATGLRLELMTERPIAGGLVRREFDIEAMIGGRRVHVEVKTNLPPLGGGAARASTEWEQIGKDLAIHAHAGYQDLLYLYHPEVRGQLSGLGQKMLDLFGSATEAPDPLLARRLRGEGVDLNTARQAFLRWLANGGLTTYEL